MKKHFMIDIETTGIDPRCEDLLQIGVLECDYNYVTRLWEPGRTFESIHHTRRQPSSEFAKKYMTELYAKCNDAPRTPASQTRQQLLKFFADCGADAPPEVYLMGWNASNFDIPFLVHERILEATRYEAGADGKDRLVGDFHYRVYEMSGALALAADVLNLDKKAIIGHAEYLGNIKMLEDRSQHDGLYDCYKQLNLLNGLIELMKVPR